MTINVTFEDLEEMRSFARKIVGEIATPQEKKPGKVSAVKEKEAAAPGEEKQEMATKEEKPEESVQTGQEAPGFTLETVRMKLAELQRSGKKAQVKELLLSFGAAKLTEIPQEQYPELMEKAGGI